MVVVSVTAILLAFVAVVAVEALPVNGPLNAAAVSVVPLNVRLADPAGLFEPSLYTT